jgi:nucleoside 2-deoxyribosyltransferase
MKLYLSHASSYDYRAELYAPLRRTLAKQHDIFFPHEAENEGVQTKGIIPICDAVLAEVSYPSTGQGIELGWASAAGVPIICFYKTGSQPSSALRFISDEIFEYESTEDLADALPAYLKRFY